MNSLYKCRFDVFSNAYVDTAIVVLSNQNPDSKHNVLTYVFNKRKKLNSIELSIDKYKFLLQNDWKITDDHKFVLDPETVSIMQHLKLNCPRTVKYVALMKRGVLFDKSILRDSKDSNNYFRYFEGDVYRYQINMIANRWVEFGNKMKEKPKDFSWFEGERLLLRRLVNRRQQLMAILTAETFITNKNLYTIKMRDNTSDIRVLLGIINSKLISFLYLKQVTQATKDDFPQVTIRDILSLPFPSEIAIANKKVQMVSMVEKMIDLLKHLAQAKLPQKKTVLNRQIDTTDRQIDELVYELYGLTEEEIKIVESGT